MAGEDGADDADSRALPITRAALLSRIECEGRAAGSEVMMPVERVGMLSPMPVEDTHGPFLPIFRPHSIEIPALPAG